MGIKRFRRGSGRRSDGRRPGKGKVRHEEGNSVCAAGSHREPDLPGAGSGGGAGAGGGDGGADGPLRAGGIPDARLLRGGPGPAADDGRRVLRKRVHGDGGLAGPGSRGDRGGNDAGGFRGSGAGGVPRPAGKGRKLERDGGDAPGRGDRALPGRRTGADRGADAGNDPPDLRGAAGPGGSGRTAAGRGGGA